MAFLNTSAASPRPAGCCPIALMATAARAGTSTSVTWLRSTRGSTVASSARGRSACSPGATDRTYAACREEIASSSVTADGGAASEVPQAKSRQAAANARSLGNAWLIAGQMKRRQAQYVTEDCDTQPRGVF